MNQFNFQEATPQERKIYFNEEWSEKDLPDFIKKDLNKREFGFDHRGTGPNDRYRVFNDLQGLRRFMRYRSPFAAYCSVAFYNKPRKRGDWLKSELIFDVDAKDLPIRSCNCDSVCEICLNEAKEIVMSLIDTLKGDLGLKDINVIYSGRGYHIRILDDRVTQFDSDMRSQILKYVVASEDPTDKYKFSRTEGAKPYNFQHFSIPIGYPAVFTARLKYSISHLTGKEEIDGINPKLLKDIIKNRELLESDEWGLFKSKIGPRRYNNLVSGFSKMNIGLVDAKVSIDLKRILRLPTSLHSKVSMKCTLIKNLENFDPLDQAVPQFVYDRK